MANAEGSDNMLNRVMPKDNIGLAALLRTKEAAWDNGEYSDTRNQFYLAVKSNSWVYVITSKNGWPMFPFWGTRSLHLSADRKNLLSLIIAAE